MEGALCCKVFETVKQQIKENLKSTSKIYMLLKGTLKRNNFFIIYGIGRSKPSCKNDGL